MKILFYLVHPAKFQFHKVQIKTLKDNGHTVDIIINTKDILEDLLKEEGWQYTNLFPEGRKIKGVHVYIAAFISIFRTVTRLFKFTKNKKYDLFIGDLLTIVGRLRGVPSLYPTDDVIRQVPEQSIFLFTTNHIIAPYITELGIFNRKKINYDGYKALAHLHPNHFTPNRSIISSNVKEGEKYFLIRCTGFGATHDIGRSGVDDKVLRELIEVIKNHGQIFITSERQLPVDLKKYQLVINKKDIHHYMAFADLFIGDSTTMCTEAAILGTPVVEYDDYWHEIEQMLELQYKYELINLYRPPDYKSMLDKVCEIINQSNSKDIVLQKRNNFIKEKIDVSSFLVWFIENYPSSYQEYKKNPFCQYRFK
jgi:predicted glycosyltransferase